MIKELKIKEAKPKENPVEGSRPKQIGHFGIFVENSHSANRTVKDGKVGETRVQSKICFITNPAQTKNKSVQCFYAARSINIFSQ